MVPITEKDFESYDINMEFSISASVLASGALVSESNPEHFIHEISGRMLASSQDEEVDECGTLDALLIQFDEAQMCSIEVGDTDGRIARYWEALFDTETEQLRPDIQFDYRTRACNLLIIDDVTVSPKFRGHGIARAGVERTIEIFGGTCALIACIPTPVQFRRAFANDSEKLRELQVPKCAEREALKKLQNYWLQAGFKPYKETGIYIKKPLAAAEY